MKRIKKIFKKYQNCIITYSIIIIVLLAILFVFLDLVKVLVIMFMFVALNVLVRFYRRILPGVPIEFEVVIFGSCLTTIAYGFWPGLIVALAGSISGEFLNQSISPYSLVNIFCYILVPIISLFLGPATVVSGGIALMIILNIIIFIIFVAVGYNLFKNVAFAITNVFLNYLLFSYLAVPVLGMLI